MNTMRISQRDVLDFAAWSGDCNPIHVAPEIAKHSAFGGTIVHGALSTIEALKRAQGCFQPGARIGRLEIEFRGEIRPDCAYQVEAEVAALQDRDGQESTWPEAGAQGVVRTAVSDSNKVRMAIITEAEEALQPASRAAASWGLAARAAGTLTSADDQPVAWQAGDFQQGEQFLAIHRFGSHVAAENSPLTSTQEKVLGLASYVVGMKAPGLSSLFTRLEVQFQGDAETESQLAYRLTFRNYDAAFRLLETELEIATLEGQSVATAVLQSYVRFPPADPDPATYAAWLPGSLSDWQGKVALICGASRGLGAEFAAALGAAKCRVYLACRRPNASVSILTERIKEHGGSATLVTGDVGDSQWCETTRQQILEAEGKLDVLILNACAPPLHSVIAHSDPQQSGAYILENFRLTQTPLKHFLPLLSGSVGETGADRLEGSSRSAGTVITISSSFVDEAPRGFSDYVAVKMAVEGAIKTAAHEHPATRFLIARPPKLQTGWNDTPTGAMGAIAAPVAASTILAVAAEWEQDDNLATVTEFPEKQLVRSREPAGKDWKVVLCASFTLDPIASSLQKWSTELGRRIDAELAPYAQVLQQTLDPTSSLSQNAAGAVVLLRVSDWVREKAAADSAESSLEPWLRATAQEHVEALRAHRAFAAGPTLLLLCPSRSEANLGKELIAEIELQVVEGLRDVPGLTAIVVREHHAAYEVPEQQLGDPLREEIAHIPFQDTYYHFLASLIVRHFHHQIAGMKKVVVLDCDNTLWRGVVGEVGYDGIELDEIHHLLHQQLVRLVDSGILICLCSKNEEPDVWSVFESRSDFGLRRDHIVASAVNWLPKSENLRSFAENLNLGLDSFIFLDDNPVECAEVRENCPEVMTLQWPQEPQAAMRLVNHLWEFDCVATTTEDRERTRMYRQEFERQQVRRQASNFQSFIDSLQLQVELKSVDDDLPRVSQLTLRTNQFNFTTLRRTEAELRALLEDPSYQCRAVHVRDRFGDYGLVGAFIVRSDQAVLEVDTFLLSCRVLGRGVEHRMAAEIGRLAQAAGLTIVRWRHLPTPRNTPARMFLVQLAGDALRGDAAGSSTYDAAADDLASLVFRTAALESAGEAERERDGDPAATIVRQEALRDRVKAVRQRERQVERIAQNLSTYVQLARVFGNGSDEHQAADGADARNVSDITSAVIATFAKALRLSESQVTQTDRLETLGCDSLRIVEITVALIRRFPSLPKTLLFEHRSVSGIIDAIVRLTAPAPTTQPDPAVAVPTATPPTREPGDVAIIGLSVRCAGADNPVALWELLARGESAVVPVPRQRPSFVGPLQDEREHFAGLMDGADDFDPEFFGISPREAEYLDPQLRLLLQAAWHALEDAGACGKQLDPATGVFVGAMYGDYGRFANAHATRSGSVYRCWEGFSLANRLSQVLGCHGPSLSIDTACSSSATAFHYACRALLAGECSTALVSGVNLIVDPDRLVQLGRLGILSPSGLCVPFGEGADGTVLGEGVVSLVLRPLEEAQRRGDRIYAVVKGSGLSSGAGSVGFTAPNPNAQARAASRAIAQAGIDPRTVSYIETHGTGTELGDPIEIRGLELAYCDRQSQRQEMAIDHWCAIGSIKPNTGHLEAGAGLMGILKATLQLYHRTLVPSLSSAAASPQIPFERLPFTVQRSLAPWKRTLAMVEGQRTELPLRAAVNSFGVGGSNAHVILEEPPGKDVPQPAGQDRPTHLLALSAVSESALRLQAKVWREHLAVCDDEVVAGACFSANMGRKHHRVRAAVVVTPEERGQEALARIASGQTLSESGQTLSESGQRLSENGQPLDPMPPMRTALLFSGQGAQYPRMLHDLHRASPVFRSALDRCARFLDDLLPRPLDEVIFSGGINDRTAAIHQTGFTQPALFSIQYALWALWKSWGIRGDVLMGHSIGEVAAYCVAGGCSVEDALRLVAARGRLMQALPPGGVMSSVAADVEQVRRAIADQGAAVSIAAINGAHQTVISGAVQAVARVTQVLQAAGTRVTELTVSHAFHSSLMEPMLDEFATVLRGLELGTPGVPIVSSASGALTAKEMADPQYWLDQARQPVRFSDAMAALDAQGVTHFLELGPHPVLLGLGRQCLADSPARWLPSAQRGREDWPTILSSLATFAADGAEVDWREFDAPYHRRRVQVPGYHFDTQRVWLEGLDATAALKQGERQLDESGGPVEPSDRWVYQLDWQEVASEPGASQDAVSSPGAMGGWLVLAKHAAVIQQVLGDLRDRGIEATGVQLRLLGTPPDQGDTQLGEMAAGEGAEQPRGREVGSCASIAELKRLICDHAQGSRILWLGDQADPDNPERLGEQVLEEVDAAAQVVSAAQAAGVAPRTLWWITQRAVAAGSGSAENLAAAPLWGLARVAALEHSELWGGVVDVDDWPQQAGRVIDEILAPGDELEIAFRHSQRLVPRLERRPLSRRAGGEAAIDFQDGAVLITGGLGSLGLRLASRLAKQGARRLILASRSAVVAPIWEPAVTAIRRSGVEVTMIAADVSTRAGVEACLQARGDAPLVGVFHLAGIDRQLSITETSGEQVREVLAAKVNGAWLLHRLCQSPELRVFVSFSSIAAVWGSAGRGLYAAANAFLDTLTHHRRDQGLPALAINFGPLKGGGMADENALALLEKMGNYGLDPDAALALVDRLLREPVTQAVVADVDWSRLRPLLEARRPRPLLGSLGHEQASPSKQQPPSGAGSGGPAWVVALRQVAPGERRGHLVELLRSELAALLRIGNPASIAKDTDLYELGLDSLTAAEFAMKLSRQTGVAKANLLLREPRLGAVAEAILQQLESPLAAVNGAAQVNGSKGTPLSGGKGIWGEPPAEAEQGFHGEELLALLTTELMATLGRRDATPPSPLLPFPELGLDSLGSVEFANRVRARLKLSQVPRVLDFNNLRELAEHLQGKLPPPKSQGVIGYREELQREIIDFYRRAWPRRREDWLEPRWKWMFVDSAKRLGVEPRVWLYEHEGRIAGHHGAQFIRFKIGDVERTTAWLVDTMVLDGWRQAGVGTRLVMQSQADMPFNLSLGQSEQMRTILEKLGWRRVGPLQTYLFMLKPSRVLRDKLPAAVLPAASAWFHLKGKSKQLFKGAATEPTHAREIERFGDAHDELWCKIADDYGCATVRDASYLNWKYVDQPGQAFIRLEILRGEQVIACVVLSIAEPDRAYRYRRLFIVDLVVRTKPTDLNETLRQVVAHGRASGVDAIVMHVINPAIEQALDRLGFIRRTATRHLVVASDPTVDQQSLLDPQQWLVTQGDSDIDRPW